MNKSERNKLHESVRAEVLNRSAADLTLGLYRHVSDAREVPALLHRLSKVIANNGPMAVQERMFLSHLLSRLSEGFDVRKELRIDAKKDGHNPSQGALNSEIVQELERRMVRGKVSGKDFAAVGDITGKTADAVRIIWARRNAPTVAQQMFVENG